MYFYIGKVNISILLEGKFDIIKSKIILVVLIFFLLNFVLWKLLKGSSSILNFPFSELSNLQHNKNCSWTIPTVKHCRKFA